MKRNLFKTVSLTVGLLYGAQTIAADIQPVRKPLQFVLLAFDGSEIIDRWKDTRQFAKENNIKFTYFVSGVLFVGRTHPPGQTQPGDMIMAYQGPHKNPGQSDIGFSGYTSMNSATKQPVITERIEQMNLAMSEGHELGSHLNGHFDASDWSASDWDQEFNDFNKLLFDPIYTGSLGKLSIDRSQFLKGMNYQRSQFVGFRTPYLSQNANLYPILQKYNFTYDTSKTAEPSYWPEKNPKTGIWNFPLAELTMANPRPHEQIKTLSMDYNFYVSQQDEAHRENPVDATDPKDQEYYYQQMLDTYRAYFKENYEGNRAPVSIGHHFAMWNSGIYWRAMKSFAADVCNLKDVRCITYKDLVQFMESLTPDELLAYKHGVFTNEPPVLAGIPSLFTPMKSKRKFAEAEGNYNSEITYAKMLLKSMQLHGSEREQLERYVKRWEKFDEDTTRSITARVSREESRAQVWLNKIERRVGLRNHGFDKTYKQLREEHLGHIPSHANRCEGGGEDCDGD